MMSRSTYSSMPRLTHSSNQKYYHLKNKTTPYKKDFEKIQFQQMQKTNIYQLATSIYKKQSKDSNQSPGRISSSKIFRSTFKNPEQPQSPHLKKKQMMDKFIIKLDNQKLFNNLNKKTLKVPQYTQLLMNLGNSKEASLQKIQIIRNHMAQQNTLKYRIGMVCRKHMNIIQNLCQNMKKMRIQMNKLEISCNETNDEIRQINNDITILNKNNEDKQNLIEDEEQKINKLLEFNKTAKYAIIKQDKILNEVKTKLTVSLKNLENSANYIKYLEAQKAQMLLHINKEYQKKWNNKGS